MEIIDNIIFDKRKLGSNKSKKVEMASSDKYEIYLGTFAEKDNFTWYSIKKLDNFKDAYKAFKTYVNTQLKYTAEELKNVWGSGRLDIELRKGSKLLNWIGCYEREVSNLTAVEEKKVEGEDKPKGKSGAVNRKSKDNDSIIDELLSDESHDEASDDKLIVNGIEL